jgi:hypothetical protein
MRGPSDKVGADIEGTFAKTSVHFVVRVPAKQAVR